MLPRYCHFLPKEVTWLLFGEIYHAYASTHVFRLLQTYDMGPSIQKWDATPI